MCSAQTILKLFIFNREIKVFYFANIGLGISLKLKHCRRVLTEPNLWFGKFTWASLRKAYLCQLNELKKSICVSIYTFGNKVSLFKNVRVSHPRTARKILRALEFYHYNMYNILFYRYICLFACIEDGKRSIDKSVIWLKDYLPLSWWQILNIELLKNLWVEGVKRKMYSHKAENVILKTIRELWQQTWWWDPPGRCNLLQFLLARRNRQ